MATEKEQALLDKIKSILPANFIGKEPDDKLLAYVNLTIADINAHTPVTSYTAETLPASWEWITVFGATLFANLFLQANYALKDFGYNDNGLSLTTDRQAKLSSVYEKELVAYDKMKWGLKKVVALNAGPLGFGMPRFQSQMGQFLKIVYGSAYYSGRFS